jgi:hypothetical protein
MSDELKRMKEPARARGQEVRGRSLVAAKAGKEDEVSRDSGEKTARPV